MAKERDPILDIAPQPQGWEYEEKASYDLESLRTEHRDALYSEKGRKLLEDSKSPTNPSADEN